jgi:ribonuclease HI
LDILSKVEIYTDGCCHGNPGKGGYGVILSYEKENGDIFEKEISAGYENTTNNRMELLAAIVGLEALKRPCDVSLYSDSKYLVDAFNQKWINSWVKNNWNRPKTGPVKNVDLWKRLLKVKEQHKVKFIWVKGHSDNEKNERCDLLANAAANISILLKDEGME